jgi:hypothetical protein
MVLAGHYNAKIVSSPDYIVNDSFELHIDTESYFLAELFAGPQR